MRGTTRSYEGEGTSCLHTNMADMLHLLNVLEVERTAASMDSCRFMQRQPREGVASVAVQQVVEPTIVACIDLSSTRLIRCLSSDSSSEAFSKHKSPKHGSKKSNTF